MDILQKIVVHKHKEVADKKEKHSFKSLEQGRYFERNTVSMVEYIRQPDSIGIIAEFKRQSPSKGVINSTAKVEEVTQGYVNGGASGLSILTDEKFFGGRREDIELARKMNTCPILRKDFIVDEYQVVEAKAIGADMILLIAAVLSKEEVRSLASTAKKLNLEVLLEIHNESELNTLCPDVDLVGVNNRNLKTFETSIDISKKLAPKIPSDFLKISESGIHDADTIVDLKCHGFEGFLVGERFMASAQPEEVCREFIVEVKSKIIQP